MLKPFHIHRGRNFWRIVALIIFILLGIYSFYMISMYGPAFIPLTIGALVGIVSIRFPKVYIFDDRFQVLKKCMLDYFTENYIFEFKDLKDIEFSGGFTDKNHVIVLALTGLLGAGGQGAAGNTKADQMIIKTKDGETTVINRFGKRSEFIKTIDLIKNNIRKGI